MKPLLPTTYDRLAKMIGVSFRNWPSEDELEEVFKNLKIGTVFPLFQKIDI
jgi:methionyl-tRNA synthetase